MPTFDEVDQKILERALAAREDNYRGKPRIGDFVVDLAGDVRRISHGWDGWGEFSGYQTTVGKGDTGSFYLGESGWCSYSGSLCTTEPESMFDAMDDEATMQGWVWFFHHGHRAGGNGVHVKAPFRCWLLKKTFNAF